MIPEMTPENLNTCVGEAAAAIIAGNRLIGRLNVENAIGSESGSIDTWLLYAWTADSPAAAELAIARAIKLDPENQLAIAGQQWIDGINSLTNRLVDERDQQNAIESESEDSFELVIDVEAVEEETVAHVECEDEDVKDINCSLTDSHKELPVIEDIVEADEEVAAVESEDNYADDEDAFDLADLPDEAKIHLDQAMFDFDSLEDASDDELEDVLDAEEVIEAETDAEIEAHAELEDEVNSDEDWAAREIAKAVEREAAECNAEVDSKADFEAEIVQIIAAEPVEELSAESIIEAVEVAEATEPEEEPSAESFVDVAEIVEATDAAELVEMAEATEATEATELR